jgi:hypothetical protein
MGELEYASGPEDGAGTFAPKASCLLAGPSGSGKTLLVWAISGASGTIGGAELMIEPMADQEKMREFAGLSLHGTLPHQTGDSAEEYEFLVRYGEPNSAGASRIQQTWQELGRRRWARINRPEFIRLEVVDGPGDALLASQTERERIFECRPKLLKAATSAASLVLCVNAARPQLATLHSELPIALRSLSGNRGYLPFSKVILVLTQIDRVVDRFLSQVRRANRGKGGSASSPLAYLTDPRTTPRVIGEILDPWALANAVLGRELLLEIWKRIAPGRVMAVCIASATGFAASDAMFVSASRVRPHWEPFGVRELVAFLVSRPDGCVCRNSLAQFERYRGEELPPCFTTEIILERRRNEHRTYA